MSSGNEYFRSTTGDTAGDWPSLKYYYPSEYYYPNDYTNEQGYCKDLKITLNNEDYKHNKILEIIDNLLCSLKHCIDIKRFKEISDQLIMLKQYNNWLDDKKWSNEQIDDPEKIKLEEDLFEL